MKERGKRVDHVRKECARTTIGRGQVRCFLGVICCDWVKLFNPAGIKHRRHAWNLCAGTVLEYSTEWIVGRNTPGRPRNSRFPRDLQNRCRCDSYNLHGLNPVVFDIFLHVNNCQRGIFDCRADLFQRVQLANSSRIPVGGWNSWRMPCVFLVNFLWSETKVATGNAEFSGIISFLKTLKRRIYSNRIKENILNFAVTFIIKRNI